MAPNIYWIIAARLIQGIAGGLMIPLSLPLIFSVYGKDERGRITGIWGTVVMLAPAVGPFVGGVALELASWQVLFLMNIPVGICAFIVASIGLPYTEKETLDRHSFDIKGFVSASLAIGATMMWLNLLTNENIPAAVLWSLPIIAMVAFGYFIKTEKSCLKPLLDLSLFNHSCYRISIAIATVQSIGMFVSLILVPLQLQSVMGYSPIWTGTALLCTAVSASIFVNLGGRWLDWHGPRLTVTTGLIITGLATVALGQSEANTPLWALFMLMVVRGIGLGLSYMPVTTAGLNSIPEDLLTQGAAMNNISRRVVSSAGVVVASVYLEWQRHSSDLSETSTINDVFIVTGILIFALLPLAMQLPSKVFDRAPAAPSSY